MWATVRRIVNEPLALFTLFGGAAFLLYGLLQNDRPEIVVSAAQQAALAEDFVLLNGRPPSAEEQAELIEKFIGEEILFMDALDAGFHYNDAKTRHLLIDRMRFMLSEDPPEPTEQELVDFYATHHARYSTEQQITFDHVFFETAAPEGDFTETLRASDTPLSLGEPFWLGNRLQAYDESVLVNAFGEAFLSAALAAPRQTWTGPVQSDRGLHFIKVDDVRPPRRLDYGDVRELLEEDWRLAQRLETLNAIVADRRKAYDIHVDP